MMAFPPPPSLSPCITTRHVCATLFVWERKLALLMRPRSCLLGLAKVPLPPAASRLYELWFRSSLQSLTLVFSTPTKTSCHLAGRWPYSGRARPPVIQTNSTLMSPGNEHAKEELAHIARRFPLAMWVNMWGSARFFAGFFMTGKKSFYEEAQLFPFFLRQVRSAVI